MSKQDKIAARLLIALCVSVYILIFAVTCKAQAQVRRDCIQRVYTSQIGIREATGKNDGHDVEKYLRSTKLGPGYAWCAAFVNWTLNECGSTTARSAWSPDWFPTNRLIYSHSLGLDAGMLPQRGDVFGIYFPAKNRIAHVGFIDEWKGSKVFTVEGNTNTAGSREGDGVYRKVRLTSQIFVVANWIDK